MILPPQPDIVIESVCRVMETISWIEAITLIDKDGHKPPVKLACEGTRVLPYATLGHESWRAVGLYAAADVTIAGQLVPVAADSLLLLKILHDNTIAYSVHPSPSHMFALQNLAVAHYADARTGHVEIFDLGGAP